MSNLNSVNQSLMRALLGLQFKPKHLNAATASVTATPVQTVGTGQADLTGGGTNTATVDHVYTIVIASSTTFNWKTDNGSFTNGVAITGSAQTLANGVTVTFGHTSGYTTADTFTITAPAGVSLSTAIALGNIAINQVGSGATLSIYDGNGTNGTLLYQAITAAWSAGQLVNLGYALQNSLGLYLVLSATTTQPDLTVGYN